LKLYQNGDKLVGQPMDKKKNREKMNVLIVYKLLVCSILTFQQLATQISVELLFVSRIHFYKDR